MLSSPASLGGGVYSSSSMERDAASSKDSAQIQAIV
jgi:hypothetical protein